MRSEHFEKVEIRGGGVDENMLETFNEVSKELGSPSYAADYVKVCSSCLELFGDNMVEVEVDKEVKVNLSDSTSETTGQKVVLSLDHFVQVKNDSERL